MAIDRSPNCPKCGDNRLVCWWGENNHDWYCTDCDVEFTPARRRPPAADHQPHLDSPQAFMRWVNAKGGAFSISRGDTSENDDGRSALRLHWPDHLGPIDDTAINAALRTHEAVLISWIEAVRDNHEMMIGRRYDPGSVVVKSLTLQGDGVVQTQGTKLLNAGTIVADGRLLIFQPHQVVKGGETIVVAEAWFDNGTPSGVKVRSVPWQRGKWIDGEFIPE